MAWNEPEDKDKQQDPWRGRQKSNQGPPDLDEAFRKMQKKLSGLFGNKGGNRGSSNGGFGGKNILSGKSGGWLIGFIILGLLIIWALTGIYIVDPAEQGVVLRFGRYVKTVGPGPHWIPRFIESVTIVNVQKVSNYKYSAKMLTEDENIVDVSVAVQYRIANARNYLFNVTDPTETLELATASALRQVVGGTTLNAVLTVGRSLVSQKVGTQLENILRRYKAGLVVTDVALLPAKAPEQVRAAFDDAIKAREDEQRFINQAQAYTQNVVPQAQGQAKRVLAEAQAYKQQAVLRSQGNTARFLALLPEYKAAPKVMRERLYLDSVESMLSKSSKILIDAKSGSNVFFLPLNKLLSQVISQTKLDAIASSDDDGDDTGGSTTTSSTSQSSILTGRPSREDYRGRGVGYEGN